MSLDTLANVKLRLGITGTADDDLLSALLLSADQAIASYCQRDFSGGTFTEYHSAASSFIHVRNYPITTVTSIKVDSTRGFAADTILSAAAYVVHTERGVIQSLYGPWLIAPRVGMVVQADLQYWTRAPGMVQVVYSAVAAVPEDVKQAYARLIASWYRRAKTEIGAEHQNLTQQKFGDAFVTFANDERELLPADVHMLLMPYRAPAI